MEISKRKKLEKAFYNFELNRERAEVNIAELAYCGLGTDYSKVSVQSSKTNAAEDKIIKAIDEKTEAYRWFKVVDYTLIKYRGEHKDKLIECLYFKCFSITKTARVLHIDRRTIFRWKDEILISAEMFAKDLRILR